MRRKKVLSDRSLIDDLFLRRLVALLAVVDDVVGHWPVVVLDRRGGQNLVFRRLRRKARTKVSKALIDLLRLSRGLHYKILLYFFSLYCLATKASHQRHQLSHVVKIKVTVTVTLSCCRTCRTCCNTCGRCRSSFHRRCPCRCFVNHNSNKLVQFE